MNKLNEERLIEVQQQKDKVSKLEKKLKESADFPHLEDQYEILAEIGRGA